MAEEAYTKGGLVIKNSFEKELTTITPFIDGIGLDNFINIDGVGYIRKDKIIEHFKDWEPPKPKVVIPQFVANYIEEAKSYGKGWWRLIEDDKNDNREVYDWWVDCNETNYVRAWLDGYEVEKEKMYYVKFNGVQVLAWKDSCKNLARIYTVSPEMLRDRSDSWKYTFTESEIKAIDERYWAFRVPVEEEL